MRYNFIAFLAFFFAATSFVNAQTQYCTTVPTAFNTCTPLPYNYNTVNGTISPGPLVDALSNNANCGASIENNQFYSFVASASTMSFTIDASGVSGGIQAWLYSADAGCTTPTVLDCNSNGFNSETLVSSALIPGNTYYIMIDGFAGATGSYSFTNITPPPGSGANGSTFPIILTIDSASCGLPDGKISMVASGGSAPYTYSIDGGLNFFPTGAFANLPAGTYNIVVSDSKGCTSTTTGTVSSKNTGASVNKEYCINGGAVTVTATGGTSFSWTPTAGITSANSDSSIITIVPLTSPVEYYVTSNLPSGCKNKDTVVVITVPTFTLQTTTSDDTVCLNQSAILSAIVTPSSIPSVSFVWSPDTTGQASSSLTVFPVRGTTYTVRATSAAGCIIVDSVRVEVKGIGPTVRVTPGIGDYCKGDSVSLNAMVSAVGCGINPNPSDPCPTCNFSFATLGIGTNVPASATTSNHPSPFRTYYSDARVQYLYRASELNAMGITSGTITDIAFDIAALAGNAPFNIANFNIKMSCSNLSQFTNAMTDFVPGLPIVYSVPSFTTSAGWNTFSLTNPYDWDGYSNLIIEVCYDGTGFKSAGNEHVNSTNVGFNATLAAEEDGDVGCTLKPQYIFSLRPNTRFIAGSLPLSNYTLAWTPSTGLTDPTITNPKTQVNSNVVYTLTASDGTCLGNASATLRLDTGALVSAGNDTVKCNSDSVMLVLRRLFPPVIQCISEYTMDSIPYAASAGSGTGTLAVGANQSDDGVTTNVAIPFPFSFYCTDYNTCNIDANGILTFGASPSTSYFNQFLPDAATPNNLIAGLWSDLTMVGNNKRVEYQTIGTAPNRKFVSRWINAGYGLFAGGGGAITFEIQLHETTNIIEIHLGTTNNNSANKTVGIENANGTNGLTPSNRNDAVFRLTTREAWRFTPKRNYIDLVSVNWSPSTGLDVTNNDTVLAFPTVPTTYIATATFSNGCVSTDTINVGVATLPYTLTASKDTICAGDSVTLSFNGAASTYQWTPSASLNNSTIPSPVAKPAITTNYQIKATSASGCAVLDNIEIVVRQNGSVTLGKDTNLCYYETLTLQPGGGQFTSFDWNTGATTPSINVDSSGDYFVLLEDRYCKFSSDTISVVVLPKVTVQAYSDTLVCIGDSVLLRSEPGYSTYEWSTLQTTPNITVSAAGQYSYIVIDNNNCRQQSNLVTVGIVLPPVINPTTDRDTFCVGYGSLLTAGNDSDVVYSWYLANSVQPVILVGDTVTAISAGTYIVEAARGGCKTYDSISVASKPSTFPQLVSDTTICGCDGSSSLALSGYVNEPGLTYAWSNSSTTENTTVTASGAYSLTITNAIGCAAADTINVSFICLQPVISASPANTVFEGDSLTLQANAGTYPSSSFSYLWTGDSTSIQNPTSDATLVKPNLPGQNIYTVWMTDSVYGCRGFDTISIYSIPPTLFIVPTVFSPNGDGVNDYFYPYLPNTQTMQVSLMHIYNRYGQQVYSCTNCNSQLPNAGWNGFYKNAAEPIGAYSYFIQIEGPDPSNPLISKKYFAQGSLSLIK